MRRVALRAVLAFAVFAFTSANSAYAADPGVPASADAAAAAPESAPASVAAPPPAAPAPAEAVAAPPPALPGSAPPPATPAPLAAPVRALGDLQSPEQVNVRYSAYSLPAGRWSIKTGALGVGDGDLFALLAVSYGLGGGVQLNANLAHMGVGLLNLSAGWHFIDTRYFDLGIRIGAWYGHGEWFWIANPVASKLISKLDVVKFPIELTASSTPTRWLELDFGVQYTYARLYGTGSSERSLFTDSELGTQQFFVRPGFRLFITDGTAFEVFAKLPIYSSVISDNGNTKVEFDRTWGVEAGLRSRLARGLFGNLRLQYASISDVLYGARLYPAFEVEFRP